MALWLVRTGKHGQHETRFLNENRIFISWDRFNINLGSMKNRSGVEEALWKTYPNAEEGRIGHHARQIWAFLRKMNKGDWVIVPSKSKPAIHIAEITGDYEYHPDADNPYYHSRVVKWIAQDLPRSNFNQDLLYSFGAFMTICQIRRNDAEKRVRQMATTGWTSTIEKPILSAPPDEEESVGESDNADLERVARDQIAKLILAKFKGHGMAKLVDAILQAQGYTTHLSPEGPDKGVDILAASGPMGFGAPRICVQVKSGNSPLDRPTLDQLIGAMQNVQAQHGLLVSWGGYKSSVDREEATQFFRVRLWNQDDLIEHLLAHYEDLPDSIRAELPLKRIWTITGPDEEA